MTELSSLPNDFVRGPREGVVAFTTEIAEPDKDGGALRYRGVDIEDLVDHRVTFGDVWALLVDGGFGTGWRPPNRSRCRSTPATSGSTSRPAWPCSPHLGVRAMLDIDDATARDQLARASVMALSYVAQSARGIYQPAVPASAASTNVPPSPSVS